MSLDRRAWVRVQRRLSRVTAWPSLLVLAIDVALLVQAARWQSTLLFLLAFVHLYLLHHECVHNAVFLGARRNQALGHLLGIVLLYPFAARREAHLLHHSWTNHPERDPATARALARMAAMSSRQLRLLDVLWRCGVPVFAFSERISLWSAFVRDRTQRALLFAYLAGSMALGVFSSSRGGLGCLVAAFYLLLVAEELINLPHHLHTPLVNAQLSLWQQDAVSHSLRWLPLWSPGVLLNFNLHAAHHVFPHQPWYRLRRLDRLLHRPAVSESELGWSLRERRRPFQQSFRQFLAHARGDQDAVGCSRQNADAQSGMTAAEFDSR